MNRNEIFENIDKNLIGKFKKYHVDNLGIYEQFEKYSIEMISGGRKKYSAWSIVNIIRWNYDLIHDDLFKINNDYIALYARLFIYNNYHHNGFFEFRTMKSSNRKQSNEEIKRKQNGNL